jgi:lipopolysaccharide/colanic/teichoic acid biosynthesis glycosyltransferase
MKRLLDIVFAFFGLVALSPTLMSASMARLRMQQLRR